MGSSVADALPGALKPAPHQVAGHRFEEGRLGSMVDDSGKFYKPLQSGERGDAEATFYSQIHSDPSVPAQMLKIFPTCHGVVEVPGAAAAAGDADSEAVKTRFLAMEDLTAGYERPCIIDIKMGRRTWFEGASQKYIDKCLEKDASTTSGALGYRIAGLQVYDPAKREMWKAGRGWCKEVTVGGMPAALAKFFSTQPETDAKADLSIAQAVLNGDKGLFAQLQVLRDWFGTQTSYQFYSSSILVTYEGKPEGVSQAEPWVPKVSLRLVDFAHVTQTGAIDSNFLEAIDAVVEALKALLQ